MPIDLHTDSPEAYVAEATPLDLATAIQALPAWDDLACRVADYLFNAWVLIYSMRRNDREGLNDLEYALHHALERAPAHAELPDQWRQRWQAYHDLVRNRARLTVDDAAVANLLSRKHVPETLAHLAAQQSEAAQGDLRAALSLGHERMSQILRQMESLGLIQRRRSGKENLIALTEQGRSLAPAPSGHVVYLPGRLGLSAPRELDALLAQAA